MLSVCEVFNERFHGVMRVIRWPVLVGFASVSPVLYCVLYWIRVS